MSLVKSLRYSVNIAVEIDGDMPNDETLNHIVMDLIQFKTHIISHNDTESNCQLSLKEINITKDCKRPHFYIINTHNNAVGGTNDIDSALCCSADEDLFVIDTTTNEWMDIEGRFRIISLC